MADMVFLTKLKPEPMGKYDAATAYGINSLVMSEDGAAAYLSVKDVPAGTPLTDAEYWKVHTDISPVLDDLAEIVRATTEVAAAEGNPAQLDDLIGGITFDSVVMKLEPVQGGEGEPSPENIRPVIAWEQAHLQNSNGDVTQEYIAKFDQAVYGGNFNWETGVFTAEWECRTLDGSEKWIGAGTASPYFYIDLGEMGYAVDGLDNQFASHYPIKTITSSNANTNCMYVYNSTSLGLCRLNVRVNQDGVADRDAWKVWLAEQHAAGTPVQICFKLGTPVEIKFDPHRVKQLRGNNVLSGDGLITVVGRKNKAEFEETDPTVPLWAKQPNKPGYTADEVGAQPKGDYALKSEIPSVPVQSVNGKIGAVQLNAEEVGAASKEEVEKLAEDVELISVCTDGIGPLVEIAESYFDVAFDENDQIVYESAHGLWADKVTTDAGVKSIVCSQFVQACIAAIDYEHSRYVQETNERRDWGFVSDGTGTYSFTNWNSNNDYMDAANMAKYFEDHGRLHVFDKQRNALLPGDLLFFQDADSTKYKQIQHVAICLGASPYRYTIMHSTPDRYRIADGVETAVYIESFGYGGYIPAFYARSPINAEYNVKRLLRKEITKKDSYKAGEISAWIEALTFDEPLQRGMYTVRFDDAGDGKVGYIKLTYANGKTQNFDGNKNAGICPVVFYAESPVSKIDVRVSAGTAYDCSLIELYKGYEH